MHIYDTSSLQAIRHAQAHTNSTYGQVIIDAKAANERKFKLLDIGSRIRVLSVRPSTHTDRFGGSSSSLLADVIGVGVIQPERVLAKMPFMTISCADDDSLLSVPCLPTGAPSDIDSWQPRLMQAAALCQSLEDVSSYKGALSAESERQAEGGWSLGDCTERVIELRRGDRVVCHSSRLLICALASTVHLPGEKRFRAMELAHNGELAQLLTLVEDELQQEARRRLALKALSGLSVGTQDGPSAFE